MSSANIYIITEQQRLNFKPTYLYIKQHSVTGLKYFGKTIKSDPIKYKGSGIRWSKHIKKHGTKFVTTLWFKMYTDIDELISVALTLSEIYDVVASDFWANIVPENGLTGGDSETVRKQQNAKVAAGTHNLLGGEISGKYSRERVLNGTHNLLGPESNKKRLDDGTHNFLDSDFQKNVQLKLLAEGSHIFLNRNFQQKQAVRLKESNKKRLDDGTHNLLGPESNKKRLDDGTHHFLTISKQKSERKLYLEIKELAKTLNIKLPPGLNMKSDDFLLHFKENILT
jgi:hypothetical protein